MSLEDDRHCDSLSGTSLGAPALSAPPNAEPVRSRSRARLGASLAAAGLLAVIAVAAARGVPQRTTPEPLKVEGRTVSYSDAFAAHAGIQTIEVREQSFSPVVSATGNTGFEPDHVAALPANALGTVRRVAKYEGDFVNQGEVLAEIGSASGASREARDALRARHMPRTTLGVSLLRSPLTGNVIERRVITGQSVRGESVIFVVANLDHLAVSVNVDEAAARHLQVGDTVELSHDTSSRAIGTGTVTRLEPRPHPDTGRSSRVQISVDNRARQLRAGQAVTVRIFASRPSRALVVPNRALAWIAGQPTVFLAASAHSASAAPVTLGDGDGEQTEVRAGLASGQRIVSDGVPTLKEVSLL